MSLLRRRRIVLCFESTIFDQATPCAGTLMLIRSQPSWPGWSKLVHVLFVPQRAFWLPFAGLVKCGPDWTVIVGLWVANVCPRFTFDHLNAYAFVHWMRLIYLSSFRGYFSPWLRRYTPPGMLSWFSSKLNSVHGVHPVYLWPDAVNSPTIRRHTSLQVNRRALEALALAASTWIPTCSVQIFFL